MILFRAFSLICLEHRDKFFGEKRQPKHKPWMRYREIHVVKEVLSKLQPESCLEWGAGYSTLFFSPMLAPTASWLSVEHEKAWAQRIRDCHPGKGVQIHHVSANEFPWTDETQDGSYSDLMDYVDYPERFAPFDFILVDGRARVPCLHKAYHLLKPGGVVLLHDANRSSYHCAFDLYPHQVLLTCYRANAGGVWLGSKDPVIENLLDVEWHQRLWKVCSVIGKVLRC